MAEDDDFFDIEEEETALLQKERSSTPIIANKSQKEEAILRRASTESNIKCKPLKEDFIGKQNREILRQNLNDIDLERQPLTKSGQNQNQGTSWRMFEGISEFDRRCSDIL